MVLIVNMKHIKGGEMYKRIILTGLVLGFSLSLFSQVNPDTLPEKYVPKVIIEAKWGDGPGEFGFIDDPEGGVGPSAIYVQGERISILDGVNNRICVFSTSGQFIRNIKLELVNLDKRFAPHIYHNGDTIASLNPSFSTLAIDKRGNVYILARSIYRNESYCYGNGIVILKYDSLGNFLSKVFTSPVKKDIIKILPKRPIIQHTEEGIKVIKDERNTLRWIESVEIYPKLKAKEDTLIFWAENKEEYYISTRNGRILKRIELSEKRDLTVRNFFDNRFLKEYPNSIKSGAGLNESMKEFVSNSRHNWLITKNIAVDEKGNYYECIWNHNYKKKGLIVIKWEKRP